MWKFPATLVGSSFFDTGQSSQAPPANIRGKKKEQFDGKASLYIKKISDLWVGKTHEGFKPLKGESPSQFRGVPINVFHF